MRIGQVKNHLRNICIKNSIPEDHLSEFIVFNSCSNKIVNKNLSNIQNKRIIPICIRQEFYSHMCLCVIIFSDIFYFDPSGEPINKHLRNFLSSKLNCRKIIQENTFKQETKFECTLSCLRYLSFIVSNGTYKNEF